MGNSSSSSGRDHGMSHRDHETLPAAHYAGGYAPAPIPAYETQNSRPAYAAQPALPATSQLQKSTTMRFQAIRDNFNSLDEVQQALRREGLESSNLIVAVDFTKSNEWTGKHSFDGRGLHSIGTTPNPYEEAISILGRTLSTFDDDDLIPCYGFGDATTSDKRVFSFLPGNEPCKGLDHVLWRYRQLVPHVRLAGPTSFAPAIEQAVKTTIESGCQYHILLIVADGQVTRASDTMHDHLSPQEQDTVQAIAAASQFPLSIIMVGVGDGPWDVMKEFDDALPTRQFDNFQFVNFTATYQQFRHNPRKLETMFALRALMEIPEQFKIIQKLGLLGRPSPVRLEVSLLNPPGPHPTPMPSGFTIASSASFRSAPIPEHAVAGSSTNIFAQSPSGRPALPALPGQSQYSQLAPGYQLPAAHSHAAGPAGSAGPTAGGGPAPGHVDPSLYLCPITQELMASPVIAADGYSYEQDAITSWLKTHNTSPMTNATLPHKNLIPNYSLRSSILEYRQQMGL